MRRPLLRALRASGYRYDAPLEVFAGCVAVRVAVWNRPGGDTTLRVFAAYGRRGRLHVYEYTSHARTIEQVAREVCDEANRVIRSLRCRFMREERNQ